MALVIALVSLLAVCAFFVLKLFKRQKPIENKDKSFDRDGVEVVSEDFDKSGYTIVHVRASTQWVRRNLPDVTWTDHDIIAFHLASGIMGRSKFAGVWKTEWDLRERFNVWVYRREGGR